MKSFNLVGVDGNAFSVMAYVVNAMKEADRHDRGSLGRKTGRFNKEAQSAYQREAMSSDYNNLLCVSMNVIDDVNQYLNLEEDEDDEE